MLLLIGKNIIFQIIHTLSSFIIDNFVITPMREELIELKQNDNDNNIIILKSAQINVFRWYYSHINRQNNRQFTCHHDIF